MNQPCCPASIADQKRRGLAALATLTQRVLFIAIVVVGCLVTTVLHAAQWETNYALALAKGKAEKKCVLLDFTGSDWCGPCIEMKKVVFSKPEFATYADKNLVLVEVDSPHHKSQPEELKQQNERLKKQYGVDKSGWPTVVLLDPDGKILGRIEGYNGQKPADIIAWASKLAASRK